MKFMLVLTLALAAVSAQQQSRTGLHSRQPYSFAYQASRHYNGAPDREHREESDGNTIRGVYRYVDPNLEVREVVYRADETGFHVEGGNEPQYTPEQIEARERHFALFDQIAAERGHSPEPYVEPDYSNARLDFSLLPQQSPEVARAMQQHQELYEKIRAQHERIAAENPYDFRSEGISEPFEYNIGTDFKTVQVQGGTTGNVLGQGAFVVAPGVNHPDFEGYGIPLGTFRDDLTEEEILALLQNEETAHLMAYMAEANLHEDLIYGRRTLESVAGTGAGEGAGQEGDAFSQAGSSGFRQGAGSASFSAGSRVQGGAAGASFGTASRGQGGASQSASFGAGSGAQRGAAGASFGTASRGQGGASFGAGSGAQRGAAGASFGAGSGAQRGAAGASFGAGSGAQRGAAGASFGAGSGAQRGAAGASFGAGSGAQRGSAGASFGAASRGQGASSGGSFQSQSSSSFSSSGGRGSGSASFGAGAGGFGVGGASLTRPGSAGGQSSSAHFSSSSSRGGSASLGAGANALGGVQSHRVGGGSGGQSSSTHFSSSSSRGGGASFGAHGGALRGIAGATLIGAQIHRPQASNSFQQTFTSHSSGDKGYGTYGN